MYDCYLKTYIILQNNLKYDNTFHQFAKNSIISCFLYNTILNFKTIQKKLAKKLLALKSTISYIIF